MSVTFTSENRNTIEIEHSLLIYHIAIPRYGWGSYIQFKSTDLVDNPHSYDSRSIRKQTANFFISEILMDSVVN